MSSDVTKVMVKPVVISRLDSTPMAVISDIHSNLEALEAVLADIKAREIERIVCLGDVVGYGPDPAACWRLIRERCHIVIRGNHDQALGDRDMARFHPRARNAIEWTRNRLGEEPDGDALIEAIVNLPRNETWGNHLYVHGSPAGPTMDYLLPGDSYDRSRMSREFALVRSYAFNGHTHIPGVIEKGTRFMTPEALVNASYNLVGQPAIINVGSVGQPRDGNPMACYITIVNGVVQYHRVAYDAETVCGKILAEPMLDPFLGKRLLSGY